jgi:hypothetical protein
MRSICSPAVICQAREQFSFSNHAMHDKKIRFLTGTTERDYCTTFLSHCGRYSTHRNMHPTSCVHTTGGSHLEKSQHAQQISLFGVIGTYQGLVHRMSCLGTRWSMLTCTALQAATKLTRQNLAVLGLASRASCMLMCACSTIRFLCSCMLSSGALDGSSYQYSAQEQAVALN